MTELEKRASRMKWSPPAPGSKERNEMPASAFLSPSTKTFPYKVLIDGQWVVSVPGLRSAISVANFRGNSVISAKASKLLEKLTADEAEHGDKSKHITFSQEFGNLNNKSLSHSAIVDGEKAANASLSHIGKNFAKK